MISRQTYPEEPPLPHSLRCFKLKTQQLSALACPHLSLATESGGLWVSPVHSALWQTAPWLSSHQSRGQFSTPGTWADTWFAVVSTWSKAVLAPVLGRSCVFPPLLALLPPREHTQAPCWRLAVGTQPHQQKQRQLMTAARRGQMCPSRASLRAPVPRAQI